MTYRQSKTYSHKMPQKLTTTACFIQEEQEVQQAVVVSL